MGDDLDENANCNVPVLKKTLHLFDQFQKTKYLENVSALRAPSSANIEKHVWV